MQSFEAAYDQSTVCMVSLGLHASKYSPQLLIDMSCCRVTRHMHARKKTQPASLTCTQTQLLPDSVSARCSPWCPVASDMHSNAINPRVCFHQMLTEVSCCQAWKHRAMEPCKSSWETCSSWSRLPFLSATLSAQPWNALHHNTAQPTCSRCSRVTG